MTNSKTLRRRVAPVAMAALAAAGTLLASGSGVAAQSVSTDRSFTAEGSDTIFAMGARHIAMGGTGTATADDAYAIFYNPALLTDLDRPTASLTRQVDGELRPYSFIGGAMPLDWLAPYGLDLTVGVARYNRVHARAEGAYAEDDLESVFLRYLLPGLSGDYDGVIDSKTLVNRVAIGVAPQDGLGLAVGVNLDYIDCRTGTCGVEAGGSETITRSVRATAKSLGLSARYRPNERLTFGASWTDINTTLTATQVRIDGSGGQTQSQFQAKLPSKIALEAAYQVNDRLLVAGGYQRLWGNYGTYSLDFQTVHAGAEYDLGRGFTLRGGAWAPVVLESSLADAFDVPFPFAPTVGLGWENGGFSADFALYAHPVRSYSEDRPVIAADLSVGWTF